jgi:prevent-host-death family protein
MPAKTISARQFHQDTAGAARAARKSPVIVTNRGRPSLVLLSFDEYSNLASPRPKKGAKEKTIVELLAMPEGTPAFDADFEFPRLEFRPRTVDLD